MKKNWRRTIGWIVFFVILVSQPVLILASPQSKSSAEEAASRIIAAAKALAILGFTATVLICSGSALISKFVYHRQITISYWSLIGATAFLVMLFTLDSFYAFISSAVGLQSQYKIAIEHVSYRINNTKALLNNFALAASVTRTVGGALMAAGEAGLQYISPQTQQAIGKVASKFGWIGALSIVAAGIGAALYSFGSALYSMFSTLTFYCGFFFLTLYGLLFLLKFFGELPLWYAFACLGLSIAAFKPLRGLGASLFATMIVFGIGLPLVINGMELAMEAMDNPSHKAIVCGVEITEDTLANLMNFFAKLLPLVLLKPGDYIWCVFEGLAKMAVVPSVFYGIGLGILAAGATELARWMSESAAFSNIAYSLASIVRPV